MATQPADNHEHASLELPVEELLQLAKPLPPHEDLVVSDLSEEEALAFFEAVNA